MVRDNIGVNSWFKGGLWGRCSKNCAYFKSKSHHANHKTRQLQVIVLRDLWTWTTLPQPCFATGGWVFLRSSAYELRLNFMVIYLHSCKPVAWPGCVCRLLVSFANANADALFWNIHHTDMINCKVIRAPWKKGALFKELHFSVYVRYWVTETKRIFLNWWRKLSIHAKGAEENGNSMTHYSTVPFHFYHDYYFHSASLKNYLFFFFFFFPNNQIQW